MGRIPNPMTHEKALNAILARACRGHEVEGHDGYFEYSVELHCAELVVVAKPLGDCQYEILEIRKAQDNSIISD